VSDRLAGLLLFLPVPVVLVLFTRQPLGAWPSLGLGLLLAATHRFYARPFALSRARRRCLWCGGAAGNGSPAIAVDEPVVRREWQLCGEAHLALAQRTLAWADAHRRFLAIGVLGSLTVFMVLAVAAASGRVAALRMGDAVAVFRLGVAVSVLPFGWLAPSRGRPRAEPPRLPFPAHVQALIGTFWVIWLFRLVGLWWLAAGALHLIRLA
jgi:hypothetical protein